VTGGLGPFSLAAAIRDLGYLPPLSVSVGVDLEHEPPYRYPAILIGSTFALPRFILSRLAASQVALLLHPYA
jgi:hypothetical protein